MLVTTHTQRLSQEEGYRDGATEAGQVMLGRETVERWPHNTPVVEMGTLGLCPEPGPY